jgi:hypothetical protein
LFPEFFSSYTSDICIGEKERGNEGLSQKAAGKICFHYGTIAKNDASFRAENFQKQTFSGFREFPLKRFQNVKFWNQFY